MVAPPNSNHLPTPVSIRKVRGSAVPKVHMHVPTTLYRIWSLGNQVSLSRGCPLLESSLSEVRTTVPKGGMHCNAHVM